MRAVKSVLNMAGGLKRAEPDIDEDLVLIRAMRVILKIFYFLKLNLNFNYYL